MKRPTFHTKLTDTANAGLRVAAPDIVVGYSKPGTIFSRMDLINTQAQTLDAHIRESVAANTAWRQGWNKWLTEWNTFIATFAGPNASYWSRAGTLTPSGNDAFVSRVNIEEGQLDKFNQEYNAMAGVQYVEPLPDTSVMTTGVGGSMLPWWFWVMGGIALVGVGYVVYRKVQEGRAKYTYARKQAPGLLKSFLGPELGQKAYDYHEAGRDYGAIERYARGPEPLRDPRPLAASFAPVQTSGDVSPHYAQESSVSSHDRDSGFASFDRDERRY